MCSFASSTSLPFPTEGHQQRKREWAENDYYDSDEDDFLDRTGDIQRRRLKRMKASGSAGQEGGAETYDSLVRSTLSVVYELDSRTASLSGLSFALLAFR